jgi:rfaE bifunctional protein nucleotidyltransferase chain/domain
MKTLVVSPVEKDLQIIRNNSGLQTEQHEEVSYLNKVCEKPWGYEFLVHQSPSIGIWCLTLREGHKTSLHCHFRKDTWIVVLEGCAKIQLSEDTHILHPMDAMLIPKYTFHSLGTYAPSTTILEIEVFDTSVHFSDKNDLLRVDDTYKRKPVGYESSVQVLSDDLERYHHFTLDSNHGKWCQRVTVSSPKDLLSLPSYERVFLLRGIVRSGRSYIKEGSLLDLSTIQFEQPIDILCLSKIDWQEDQKIIYSMDHLKEVVRLLKLSKETLVLTSGCFDILHVGHLQTLKRAKALGTKLLVCLSSDEQIKALKGPTRPINNNEDRMSLFKTIQYVDFILPYQEQNIVQEQTLGEIMKLVDPDLWVKGSDYTKQGILEKHPYLRGIALIDLVQEKSTTNIIQKILNA